jgi:hypothetical protein
MYLICSVLCYILEKAFNFFMAFHYYVHNNLYINSFQTSYYHNFMTLLGRSSSLLYFVGEFYK